MSRPFLTDSFFITQWEKGMIVYDLKGCAFLNDGKMWKPIPIGVL